MMFAYLWGESVENNKLLIGVQFTERDFSEKNKHTCIELYVVRDITLMQLMDGIKYGLDKLAKSDSEHKSVYVNCVSILSKCLDKTVRDKDGELYFRNITFTSFNAAVISESHGTSGRFMFSTADLKKPLYDLGFITSSKIIFDATGMYCPKGMLDTKHIVEAFNPKVSSEIFFPEYNISTRQLYCFDDSAVDVIAPTEPPQKPNHGLVSMLLPSVLSIGIMMIVRTAMASSGAGSGKSMILLSVAMGITVVITTILSWLRQKKQYRENLKNWRDHYEEYINSLIASIRERQKKDAQKLNELYPDVLTMINPDSQGIYAINENIYSRSAQDEDFLTFRMGRSEHVPSFFKINGEKKDTVYSDAFFELTEGYSGSEQLHIYLRNELQDPNGGKENLCKLPGVIAQKHAFLPKAPLLYSLKNKVCLGVVDRYADRLESRSNHFISRMIFELCYYHSPEELQFVVFFNKETDWQEIEKILGSYKFMPHFRGLFDDRSQFVFDQNSAHLVMNSLLTTMYQRHTRQDGENHPHIVMIVLDEYGLKEHAFAEYLPKPPKEGKVQTNELGLSFVFVKKHKEYLPAYCDDVVNITGNKMVLTPHSDVEKTAIFTYDEWDSAKSAAGFYCAYTENVTRALWFFSSVYYAKNAQNRNVPSSVSFYEVAGVLNQNLKDIIHKNWNVGQEGIRHNAMSSLRIPIGKTENGLTYLDLHEKADGPHMLVAGTTGSGKTETVISYLLGLCMRYRPDELNLLLVDMKGGGFTKRIGHLPHVVGAVTDVDGDENGTGAEYMLGRFLNAMKSEIKRRKLLFNKLHVDSIDGYIRAYGDIEAHISKKKLSSEEATNLRTMVENKDDSLSHLILVVDEFTELKRFSAENGDVDFIQEITAIARIGRSLGVHIILISQNIEGAITDDIRVNSNARLCLKVATKQASKEMIGTELAASPYMPGNGRAYLLVGTGSKFEYFQSAYSGADVEESIPVEISLASKSGAYVCFYRSDKDNAEILKRAKAQIKYSQLEAVCEAIREVYTDNAKTLIKPHTVFSSPLSTCIAWDRDSDAVIDLSKRK